MLESCCGCNMTRNTYVQIMYYDWLGCISVQNSLNFLKFYITKYDYHISSNRQIVICLLRFCAFLWIYYNVHHLFVGYQFPIVHIVNIWHRIKRLLWYGHVKSSILFFDTSVINITLTSIFCSNSQNCIFKICFQDYQFYADTIDIYN